MANGFTISNRGQSSSPTTDRTVGSLTVNVTNVMLTDLKSTVGGDVLASLTAELDACGTAKLDGAFTLEQGNGAFLKAVF